jgi:hypothetical protein
MQPREKIIPARHPNSVWGSGRIMRENVDDDGDDDDLVDDDDDEHDNAHHIAIHVYYTHLQVEPR